MADLPSESKCRSTYEPPPTPPPLISTSTVPISTNEPKCSDQILNNMLAKVTIETPSGESTKYYLLYRDRCYSIPSLFIGALGGVGVGYYSRIFFEQNRPSRSKSWKSQLPFTIPEVRVSVKVNGRLKSIPVLFGHTVWWRIGSRAVISSILYSAIECQLQGRWYRRSLFDCSTAGAISGAIFGWRGVPGQLKGSIIGGACFGAFAFMSRLLFL